MHLALGISLLEPFHWCRLLELNGIKGEYITFFIAAYSKKDVGSIPRLGDANASCKIHLFLCIVIAFVLFIYLLERTSFVFILGGFDINLRSLNPGSHVKRVDLYQLNEIPNYY